MAAGMRSAQRIAMERSVCQVPSGGYQTVPEMDECRPVFDRQLCEGRGQ
jgi:hypothetical protein